MKVLIVGGVAGGMSTAARLRRNSENDEIIVFEKGEYISFANCGLPYYIGGSIEDRNALLVQTPEAMRTRFNIDVRINNEVVSIDRDNKKVKIKDLKENKEYEENYDKLVLSPGSNPIKPQIPGIEHEKIFTLKNIPDTDKIKEFIKNEKPKTAIVVGGGYIGIEMAENLVDAGLKVTLVEAMNQVLNIVDYEIAAQLHFHIYSKGVELYLGNMVESFSDDGGAVKVSLKDEEPIIADMVIFAIGVKPDIEFIKDAGIEIGKAGGITVNEFLQTSDENIYAAGDAIEVKNMITGERHPMPLAGPANKQGRIIADNIAEGNKNKYKGSFGTGVLKVFDMTLASSGANEKNLDKAEIAYKSVIIHPGNHAGYYPDNTPMTLKLLFSPEDGKILGVQATGLVGVEKRVDVIVAYMEKEGTVYDLTEFEQSYAPPYSSAKDPVNMVGFVAENYLKGKIDLVTWKELKDNYEDFNILDVRTKREHAGGALPGAINIPLDGLRERLSEVPKGKKLAVHCLVGLRSYIAVRILKQSGFEEVYNLSGGYTTINLASV